MVFRQLNSANVLSFRWKDNGRVLETATHSSRLYPSKLFVQVDILFMKFILTELDAKRFVT